VQDNANRCQLIFYYQAMRYLLHVQVSPANAQDQYLKMAMDACGGLCQSYKRLHQVVAVGFSLMGLHSVFFAGLTMLYCAWKAPAAVLTHRTRNMISDCSIVLYIIAERWLGAKAYRDLFESIKDAILHNIDQQNDQTQMVVQHLQPSVYQSLRSMCPMDIGQDEFSAMLTEMTGGCDNTGATPQTQQQQHGTWMGTNGVHMMPQPGFDLPFAIEPVDLLPLQTPMSVPLHHWYGDL
jgi:hypothetical protein